MPLESRLTFRAALCVYQILKSQVATLAKEDIPTNRQLIVNAITLANSNTWMSELLPNWIIGFASDEKMQFRIEPMIRALSDSMDYQRHSMARPSAISFLYTNPEDGNSVSV